MTPSNNPAWLSQVTGKPCRLLTEAETSTPCAPARSLATLGATVPARAKRTATAVEAGGILDRPRPSARSSRTRSGSTTCRETSGSGSRMLGMAIMTVPLRTGRDGFKATQTAGSSAAVLAQRYFGRSRRHPGQAQHPCQVQHPRLPGGQDAKSLIIEPGRARRSARRRRRPAEPSTSTNLVKHGLGCAVEGRGLGVSRKKFGERLSKNGTPCYISIHSPDRTARAGRRERRRRRWKGLRRFAQTQRRRQVIFYFDSL
jgi:hypothetical protein